MDALAEQYLATPCSVMSPNAGALHQETDYAESDTEQLRVRIQAYLEML